MPIPTPSPNIHILITDWKSDLSGEAIRSVSRHDLDALQLAIEERIADVSAASRMAERVAVLRMLGFTEIADDPTDLRILAMRDALEAASASAVLDSLTGSPHADRLAEPRIAATSFLDAADDLRELPEADTLRAVLRHINAS